MALEAVGRQQAPRRGSRLVRDRLFAWALTGVSAAVPTRLRFWPGVWSAEQWRIQRWGLGIGYPLARAAEGLANGPVTGWSVPLCAFDLVHGPGHGVPLHLTPLGVKKPRQGEDLSFP